MAHPESLLLFYRPPVTGTGIPNEPGVAAIGRLDAAGNFTDLRTHTGFDYWGGIVPADTTSGLVLFHTVNSRHAAVGQVAADGGFADVKYLIDVPVAQRVVPTREGILIFYSTGSKDGTDFGIAQTGKLAANGDFITLSEPRLLDLWTHIVPTINGLVLFYRVDTGTAATGRITPEGAFQDLKGYTGFDLWTHIVSTSDGILLAYNRDTGAAVTGIIDAEGNYADVRNITLDRGWDVIAPTTNRLLLFSRATFSTAPETWVGQIDAQGAFTDVAPVNGLDRWTKIVSVRAV